MCDSLADMISVLSAFLHRITGMAWWLNAMYMPLPKFTRLDCMTTKSSATYFVAPRRLETKQTSGNTMSDRNVESLQLGRTQARRIPSRRQTPQKISSSVARSVSNIVLWLRRATNENSEGVRAATEGLLKAPVPSYPSPSPSTQFCQRLRTHDLKSVEHLSEILCTQPPHDRMCDNLWSLRNFAKISKRLLKLQ